MGYWLISLQTKSLSHQSNLKDDVIKNSLQPYSILQRLRRWGTKPGLQHEWRFICMYMLLWQSLIRGCVIFLWYFSILAADYFHHVMCKMYKYHSISLSCVTCDFYVLLAHFQQHNEVLFYSEHGSGGRIKDNVDGRQSSESSISWPSMGSSSAQTLGLPDFTVQHLWQCVPYILFLTASSDPLLGCTPVYFWDQTVFWSGSLSLLSV